MPEISANDREIMRRLAAEWAEAADLAQHEQTAKRWARLNDLDPIKPMVWINEIPWHEMNVNDELTLQCENPFLRDHELNMRRTLYQWRHMPGDMIIRPIYDCPLVIHDSGFGIAEDVDVAKTDETSSIVSRHFHIQIQNEADIIKIQMPEVWHDVEATEHNHALLDDAFGDLLPVQKRGMPGFWFAPWDELIRWWGVQEAMLDLVMRPELVHMAMERLTQAYLHRLDQYEDQGLLSMNSDNTRVGSGGYAYTSALPDADAQRLQAPTQSLWGNAAAQIFSDVSPKMHVEFALQYERRWLDRFALTYYGCCEPLHLKVDILRSVPNLRKISMSPWINVEKAAEAMGGDFVFSYKPNPAIFVDSVWNPAKARQVLVDVLERARGCVIELIMKDISTVHYQPQHLWQWAEIASEVTAEYA